MPKPLLCLLKQEMQFKCLQLKDRPPNFAFLFLIIIIIFLFGLCQNLIKIKCKTSAAVLTKEGNAIQVPWRKFRGPLKVLQLRQFLTLRAIISSSLWRLRANNFMYEKTSAKKVICRLSLVTSRFSRLQTGFTCLGHFHQFRVGLDRCCFSFNVYWD